MFKVTDEAANMIKKALESQVQPYAVRLLLQNG
jgi:Fe-S cluster assembly iron-binding protein IscA